MPLLRVANTRPAEQAPALSALLRAAGFMPLETPATEVISSSDRAEMEQVVAQVRASGADYVIFPSRNAVLSFVRGLLAAGAGESDLRRLRPICGPGTATEIAEYPFPEPYVLHHFSAATTLTHLTEAETLPERVIVPRAALGRDELVLGLRERGVQVLAPVVYRTVPVPPERLSPLVHALKHGEIAALTFTSSSAVSAVGAALDFFACPRESIAHQVSIVCFGPTTSDAARAAGLPPAAVAFDTVLPSLVTAVTDALARDAPARVSASADGERV